MFRDLRVAVVVPAYCEEKLIRRVIETMPRLVDRIVVVDDGSPDRTADEAVAVGSPRVQLEQHETNLGVGAAIRTGLRAALDDGADVLVVMDGDAQMNPDYLEDLIRPIADEGYGFAKANRFFSATSFHGMPRHRLIGNIGLTFLTKAASGYWNMVDPQNGFIAMSRETLIRLNLDAVASGYDFNNDLLIWLNILNVRIKDVAIPAIYGDESSTLRVHRVAPRLVASLTAGFFRRIMLKYVWWSFHPIALLLFAGIFLFSVGLVFSVVAVVNGFGSAPLPSATVMLAIAPLLSGFYLITQALVLDIQATPE